MKTSRPFVTANFALTWDARISTRNGTPADFSSPLDKQRLTAIRSRADAVLVSAVTAAADRMTMGISDETLRRERVARGQGEQPLRVLLSNSGRIDPGLRVFEKDFSTILIFSTTQMEPRVRTILARRADLWLHEGAQVNLEAMMATLRREYGVRRLVCEGGAQVFRSLLAADCLDEVHITMCPRIFGGREAPTLTGIADGFFGPSTNLVLREMKVAGAECFLRYRVVRPHPDGKRKPVN